MKPSRFRRVSGDFESKIVSEYFADIVSEWLPSRSETGVF